MNNEALTITLARALLATVLRDYGTVDAWLDHAPQMTHAPDVTQLADVAALLRHLNYEVRYRHHTPTRLEELLPAKKGGK